MIVTARARQRSGRTTIIVNHLLGSHSFARLKSGGLQIECSAHGIDNPKSTYRYAIQFTPGEIDLIMKTHVTIDLQNEIERLTQQMAD